MPVNLSIKNVPDDLAERLRQRAKRNRRSLQGELLAMLELLEGDADERRHPSLGELKEREGRPRRLGPLTIRELLDSAQRSGLNAPSEAARLVRADRDAR